MAKEIDKIIQSKTAPKSNNVLWDDGENLKINRNGKWESIGSNDLSTQVFTIPFEIFELAERVEIEGIWYDAISINALEEYYGIDWDLMVDKICKFGIIIIGYHIPIYRIKIPNDSGTGYTGIQMYILNPDNVTKQFICAISNKTLAQSAGFGNYGIMLSSE